MPATKDNLVIRDVNNLQGGINPRMTPILLSQHEGPMQSPDCRNVSMFYPGAMEKRLGKTKQGNSVFTALTQSQTNFNVTDSISVPVGSTGGFCQKIVATQSLSVSTLKFILYLTYGGIASPINFQCQIRNDNAGSPGTLVTNGTSANASLPASGQQTTQIFNFNSNPTLVSGNTYWICVVLTSVGNVAATINMNAQTGASNNVKTTTNNFGTFFNSQQSPDDLYYVLTYTNSGSTGQGLYDFRYGSPILQSIIAAVGGTIYYKNGSNYTSLKSGLGTGSNTLFDFITYKNIMIATDYANNVGQCWDGVATSTMELGYRMSPGYSSITGNQYTVSSISNNVVTFTAAPNSTFVGMIQKLSGDAGGPQFATVTAFDLVGKTVTYSTALTVAAGHTTMTAGGFTTVDAAGGTFAAGTYRIMSVTALKSGGFRASAEQVHVSAGGTKKITISNIKMNSSADGSQYAWDVDVTATKWFCTLIGGTIYYKLTADGVDMLANPMANSVTSFTIDGPPAGTENTLDVEYNLPQSYFTNQIDAPKSKFLKVYQDMVASAGDPFNLNAVWFSEQGTMHVWSTQGGYRGFKLNVKRDDGQVIKGLWVRWGRLFVLRTKSANAINFTSNSDIPFSNDELQSQLGCLSHWTIKDVDEGFKFLSQQGPAICYGSYIVIDKGAEDILNYFEANDPNQFNMSLVLFSTGFINETRKTIGWTVASNGSGTRDLILRNNYELNTYWLDDAIQANYLTQVSDSNGQAQPWSVDLIAQVFQHDNGTSDNGAAIAFRWSSAPFMPFGVGDEAYAVILRVLGDTQSSGTLYIDEYLDQSSTINATYTLDMTRKDFAGGINIPLSTNSQGHFFRYVFRNSDLNVPVKINGFKFISRPVRYQI